MDGDGYKHLHCLRHDMGTEGRGPRGAIGDTDSRSTLGPDPVAEDICTAWNEAYIMLVSCIDYALDMTCIQSVSQCFIVGGIL